LNGEEFQQRAAKIGPSRNARQPISTSQAAASASMRSAASQE
jgi:hypothetical protein